jgi:PDZ domain-containing protein
VAVTGTIEPDGSVGEVGGVAQKTAAVRAAGASYFLVPAQEAKEARAHAGSRLRIVPVGNLDQALDALRSFGGDLTALGAPPGAPRR